MKYITLNLKKFFAYFLDIRKEKINFETLIEETAKTQEMITHLFIVLKSIKEDTNQEKRDVNLYNVGFEWKNGRTGAVPSETLSKTDTTTNIRTDFE